MPRTLADIGLVPLALSRKLAAEYCGVSERAFAAGVKSGRYPPPMSGTRPLRWNRVTLEEAHGLTAAGRNDPVMGLINEARQHVQRAGADLSLLPGGRRENPVARRPRQP